MKHFFVTRYHLVLLGVALLLGVGSVALLMIQSSSLEASLKEHEQGVKATKYTGTAAAEAIEASDHLKKGVTWESRHDGASPYVSLPYLLKEGKLINPMEGEEPLHPPVPNKWLIDHHLDYADMQILERDPKHKGFTVREEFEAGTDPNDPNQFPPLANKLSYQETGIRKSSYLLEFLGEDDVIDDTGKMEKKIQIKPVSPLPNPSKNNRPDTSVRNVKRGETIPGAPFLKVLDLAVKTKNINDTDYDMSELTLQNTLTGERIILVKKNTSREYKKVPIELVESVQFTYQLNGGDPQMPVVERGKELTLASLDGGHTETYKLVDISKEGVVLEKQGKTFIVKPSNQTYQPSFPAPSPSPAS